MVAYHVFWKSGDLGVADDVITQCYGESPRQASGS
jgi:hypothetical protein